MKTAGIIAEYNPFHKGHEYQINYIREKLGADFVVAAMSGDFVQRGTPALLSKHVRAEMALRCGADLVLELPVSVSTASAEYFAKGGVELLDGLGAIDLLCFGTETEDFQVLADIAGILQEEPPAYREALRKSLKEGLSYPVSRSHALKEFFPNSDEILSSPNNILGIEYIKALGCLGSTITPVNIKRLGNAYHDTSLPEETFPSASAIRQRIFDSSRPSGLIPFSTNAGSVSPAAGNGDPADQLASHLPASAYRLLQQALAEGRFLCEDQISVLLHYRLLEEDTESLCLYQDISRDLARRIVQKRNQFCSFTQFCTLLKTKELTLARIRRSLLHVLLRIRKPPASAGYARVLGFRKEASPLLSEIKNEGKLPLLTKAADASLILNSPALDEFDQTAAASNIYQCLLTAQTGEPFLHEYQKPIVIV